MKKIEIQDADALEAAKACFDAMMALNNCERGTLAWERGGAYGHVKKALLHALAVAFGGMVNNYTAANLVYAVAMDGGDGRDFDRAAERINSDPHLTDAVTMARLLDAWVGRPLT